ncbi:hypothetical protein D3C73_1143430 [compost metagenome]
MTKFRKIYAAVLETSQASDALDQIVGLAEKMNVCLLCYERDHRDCHRKIVADRLESVADFKVRHLGVKPNVALGQQPRRVRNTGEGAPA